MLVMVLACNARSPVGDPASRLNLIPTPDWSRAQIIDRELPAGLTDPAASAAYDQGYSHMRDAAWFAAIAAYEEAIRIQPEITGLYEARGTAYMYAGRHDDALADYSLAIELDPNHAMGYGHRAIALTQLPTPDWENALADMDRHIELFPGHDTEAYKLRAWINDNLGNYEEAERVRQLAR